VRKLLFHQNCSVNELINFLLWHWVGNGWGQLEQRARTYSYTWD